jgi:hypothetical protein
MSAIAAWARSGLMALSGPPDGPPAIPSFDAMSRIDVLLSKLEEHCTSVGSHRHHDIRLVTERARLSGLTRGGSVSCNRSCRLVKTRDGWIAVNLARDCDRQALPALLNRDFRGDPWAALAKAARATVTSELIESGRLSGECRTIVHRASSRPRECSAARLDTRSSACHRSFRALGGTAMRAPAGGQRSAGHQG